ncbi:hypothetical protein FIV42_10630 [Persicimonas caeni]|uniref:VWA domain-containing protein n=1 Tax=Persicimonas caeni TaxID=2292766 RepID=A0A4Y6PS69_PERCE|nr:hypothetical protein [Persicimonas caeni]QDG51176.1 hypothetical protein FIV42_10630 [Persicimonas caeni]QED32397.1 hypothetical protein FRD00_10625 [Persicimonas caeni]
MMCSQKRSSWHVLAVFGVAMSLAACGSGGGDEPPLREGPEGVGEACQTQADCGVGLRCASSGSGGGECRLDEQSNIGPIETAAFSASQEACGAGSGETTLRFVLTDMNAQPIAEGDWVGGEPLDLQPENLTLDRGALFASADLACESDADCADGFSCGFAPAYDLEEDAALRRCYRDATLAVGTQPDSVEFLAQPAGAQVFGMLVEDAHSLDGVRLAGTTDAYDADGDGTTDAGPVDLRDSAVATDPNDRLFDAVEDTMGSWQAVARLAMMDGQQSYFGLWSFNAADTAPRAHSQPDWVAAGSGFADDAVDSYEQEQAGPSRANVYEAAVSLLENDYTDTALSQAGVAEPADAQKTLVLVVDGPDDMRGNDAVGIDDVIQAATSVGVRVFVVHFDPMRDEADAYRDDPTYHQGQDPCTSDDECKNYETCRTPRGYASAVGEPSNAPSETYCMPQRNEDGRLGPVADYERLACATGGAYLYRTTEEYLNKDVAPLPRTQRSWWQADVDLTDVSGGEADRGAYRLGGLLQVEWLGFAQPYAFSIAGGTPPRDQRGVVFVP